MGYLLKVKSKTLREACGNFGKPPGYAAISDDLIMFFKQNLLEKIISAVRLFLAYHIFPRLSSPAVNICVNMQDKNAHLWKFASDKPYSWNTRGFSLENFGRGRLAKPLSGNKIAPSSFYGRN